MCMLHVHVRVLHVHALGYQAGQYTACAPHVQALGYRGGLRVGDRLLSVNGAHCTDPTLAASMIKAAVGKVSLQIMRDLNGGSSRLSEISPASAASPGCGAASPIDNATVRSQSRAAKIKARLEAKVEEKAARERRIAAAMAAKELSDSFRAGKPRRGTPTSAQSESELALTVFKSPSFLQRLKRRSPSFVQQSSLRSPGESSHESPKQSPASSRDRSPPAGRASIRGLKVESLHESSEFRPLPFTNTVDPLEANCAGGRRQSFGMTVSSERPNPNPNHSSNPNSNPNPDPDHTTTIKSPTPNLNQVSPENKPKSLSKQISHPNLGFRLVWNDAPKAPGGDAKVRCVGCTAQHSTLCASHTAWYRERHGALHGASHSAPHRAPLDHVSPRHRS